MLTQVDSNQSLVSVDLHQLCMVIFDKPLHDYVFLSNLQAQDVDFDSSPLLSCDTMSFASITNPTRMQ
jgi:hypothetical protein